MYQLSVPINILLLLIVLWSLVWKIYAVWTACRHNHKKWFVALVLLNTAGILEIIYIFKIAKKSLEEVKGDFKRAWTSR